MQTNSTSQVNVSFFPPAEASTLKDIETERKFKKKENSQIPVSLLHSRHINFAIWTLGGSQDFCTELELETLLLQNALEVFGHLHINAHSAHMAQEFHCCHFGTQSLPHGSLQEWKVK